MPLSRTLAVAVATSALIVGSISLSSAAGAASPTVTGSSSASSFGFTFPTFPTAPTFPTFPTAPTFPTFPPALPAPPPINTSTNGTTSIVKQLAPGADDNDGIFDINEFDYHITALLLNDVLAAHPSGPASILADGTRRATFFEPRDGVWVQFARKLSGQALPLPSANSEKTAYAILKSLGISRIEKLLSYHIIPGTTLIGSLLGPPTVSQATYTTANGERLTIKSNFGVVTLVDNSSLTSNSGIVEAPMNQGNKQIAWSTAVLLPSTF